MAGRRRRRRLPNLGAAPPLALCSLALLVAPRAAEAAAAACSPWPTADAAGCDRPVASAAECSALAPLLPSIPSGAGPATSQAEYGRPSGCWWQGWNGQLYFNTLPAGVTVSCSSGQSCICCASSRTIAAVQPAVVPAGVAARLRLEGTVSSGDLLVWALDCGSLADASPIDPPDGTNVFVTFTFHAPGTYKLCYWAAGGIAYVEQDTASVTVQDSCAPALVSSGAPHGSSCPRPPASAAECSAVAGFHPHIPGHAAPALPQDADDRPPGCWWQPSNGLLFYNSPPPGTSPVGCSSVARCVCCSTNTSGLIIPAISPTSIIAGVPTAVALQGTVAPGDRLAWAADCAAATPSLDPTDGTNATTIFNLTQGGIYKLCYRASGNTDSVEQVDVLLEVVEPCIPELVTSGSSACQWPIESAETCSVSANQLQDVPDGTTAAAQSEGDRPSGCWFQRSNQGLFYNVPQAGSAPVECTDAFSCICCKVTSTTTTSTTTSTTSSTTTATGTSTSTTTSTATSSTTTSSSTTATTTSTSTSTITTTTSTSSTATSTTSTTSTSTSSTTTATSTTTLTRTTTTSSTTTSTTTTRTATSTTSTSTTSTSSSTTLTTSRTSTETATTTTATSTTSSSSTTTRTTSRTTTETTTATITTTATSTVTVTSTASTTSSSVTTTTGTATGTTSATATATTTGTATTVTTTSTPSSSSTTTATTSMTSTTSTTRTSTATTTTSTTATSVTTTTATATTSTSTTPTTTYTETTTTTTATTRTATTTTVTTTMSLTTTTVSTSTTSSAMTASETTTATPSFLASYSSSTTTSTRMTTAAATTTAADAPLATTTTELTGSRGAPAAAIATVSTTATPASIALSTGTSAGPQDSRTPLVGSYFIATTTGMPPHWPPVRNTSAPSPGDPTGSVDGGLGFNGNNVSGPPVVVGAQPGAVADGGSGAASGIVGTTTGFAAAGGGAAGGGGLGVPPVLGGAAGVWAGGAATTTTAVDYLANASTKSLCSGYTCPAGFAAKADSLMTLCLSAPCTAAQCCDGAAGGGQNSAGAAGNAAGAAGNAAGTAGSAAGAAGNATAVLAAREYVVTVPRMSGDGLARLWFYASKRLDDVALGCEPLASGTSIFAVDEGDGWLRVGDHFVPRLVAEPRDAAPASSWLASPWSACSGPCGRSEAVRAVRCPACFGDGGCRRSGRAPPASKPCSSGCGEGVADAGTNAVPLIAAVAVGLLALAGAGTACGARAAWRRRLAQGTGQAKCQGNKAHGLLPVDPAGEKDAATKLSSDATASGGASHDGSRLEADGWSMQLSEVEDRGGDPEVAAATRIPASLVLPPPPPPPPPVENLGQDDSPPASPWPTPAAAAEPLEELCGSEEFQTLYAHRCSDGQGLRKFVVPWSDDFSCDVCRKFLEKDSRLWTCPGCGYACCSACCNAASGSSESSCDPVYFREATRSVLASRGRPEIAYACPEGHACVWWPAPLTVGMTCSVCSRGSGAGGPPRGLHHCAQCEYSLCAECVTAGEDEAMQTVDGVAEEVSRLMAEASCAEPWDKMALLEQARRLKSSPEYLDALGSLEDPGDADGVIELEFKL